MSSDTPKKRVESSCARCWKAIEICTCAEIPTKLRSSTRFLILQRPQESRNPLGTARLLSLALPKETVHKVGLSWGSLSNALGESADARHWAVLFLGPLKDNQKANPELPFQVLERSGKQVPLNTIRGIVLLDGNWKQSKTLWWRNPWFLKLHRVILNPTEQSKYGDVRRQPRRGCLSTIEAAGFSLTALGEPVAIENSLKEVFERHVERVRSPRPLSTPDSVESTAISAS